MTPSPCTKMKLSPSKKSTTPALLSHISNKAETVCHHVPPHVSTRATEYLVSRANGSPGVLRYFRNNIYKPWTLGLNMQRGGNGTHAPTPAADHLQRAAFIVRCITSRGWGGTEAEKRNQSCTEKGRVAWLHVLRRC